MAKIEKNGRYYLCIVKKDTMFSMAYSPNNEYVSCGDMAELENGLMGTVILVDDYMSGEDVIEHERISGMEAQRIIGRFRRYEVDWPDEEKEDEENG